MEIIEKIIALAENRGWSRYALAKNAEMSDSTLKNIWKRKSIPSIPTLEAICDAFGISLSQFFAEDEMCITLTPEQKELLDTWARFTPAQRTEFLSLMKALLQQS